MTGRGQRLASVGLVPLAALAGLSVWFASDQHDRSERSARRAQALTRATAAAATDVPLFTNISAATINADEARATSVFTPGLASRYASMFGAFIAETTKRKATVTAQVAGAEPIDSTADGSTVRILVFYSEQAAVPNRQSPTAQSLQTVLTMRSVGGTWLVDDISTSQ